MGGDINETRLAMSCQLNLGDGYMVMVTFYLFLCI